MGLFDKIKKALGGKEEEKSDLDLKKINTTESLEENEAELSSDNPLDSEVSVYKEEVGVEEETSSDLVAKSEEERSETNSDSPVSTSGDDDPYQKGLEKTSQTFGARLNAFFAKFRSVDENFFEDLEEVLIESDVGYETALKLTDSLRSEVKLKNAKSKDDMKAVIVEKMVDLYEQSGEGKDEALKKNATGTTVYLFVGVNGAGKTTTVGKLAAKLKDEGNSVLLVAADTFRAGAVAQLQEWGRRINVPVVNGPEKADPAAVVYDGVTKAKTDKIDYLLIDTAGRLQNKVNLMNELEKIERTIKKVLPAEPTEVLLVVDGSTGQNALIQAKEFNETTKLTGLVLTKIDGSSKGGVVLAIRNEMKLSVKLVGLGEKVTDLAAFDAEKFATGLFQELL